MLIRFIYILMMIFGCCVVFAKQPADGLYEHLKEKSEEADVLTDNIEVEPSTSLSSSRRIPLVLKTNMLYDLAVVPNIGLELALGKNWSVEADWMYAWWSRDISHRYWRVYGGEVGVRRWFGRQGRRVLTGHHVGLYGQMLTYDFELGGKGFQGGRWTWGGGVSYGYSLPVGRHLNIDFTIGFGYAGGEYKKYHPDNGCYVWDSTHRLNWFGPTRAEVSLVWYIGGRPLRKGGAR